MAQPGEPTIPPCGETASRTLLWRCLGGIRTGTDGLRKLRETGRLAHFGQAFDELLERLNELLSLTESGGASADELFLKRVLAVIDAGMSDESFDVEALAARVAVGRSQLYRRLESLLGCSPARLILDRRLEHAAHLLRAGTGVSEAAFEVGFKSVSHFSQRFRERYGMRPSAYSAEAAEPGRARHELGRPRYRLPAPAF